MKEDDRRNSPASPGFETRHASRRQTFDVNPLLSLPGDEDVEIKADAAIPRVNLKWTISVFSMDAVALSIGVFAAREAYAANAKIAMAGYAKDLGSWVSILSLVACTLIAVGVYFLVDLIRTYDPSPVNPANIISGPVHLVLVIYGLVATSKTRFEMSYPTLDRARYAIYALIPVTVLFFVVFVMAWCYTGIPKSNFHRLVDLSLYLVFATLGSVSGIVISTCAVSVDKRGGFEQGEIAESGAYAHDAYWTLFWNFSVVALVLVIVVFIYDLVSLNTAISALVLLGLILPIQIAQVLFAAIRQNPTWRFYNAGLMHEVAPPIANGTYDPAFSIARYGTIAQAAFLPLATLFALQLLFDVRGGYGRSFATFAGYCWMVCVGIVPAVAISIGWYNYRLGRAVCDFNNGSDECTETIWLGIGIAMSCLFLVGLVLFFFCRENRIVIRFCAGFLLVIAWAVGVYSFLGSGFNYAGPVEMQNATGMHCVSIPESTGCDGINSAFWNVRGATYLVPLGMLLTLVFLVGAFVSRRFEAPSER